MNALEFLNIQDVDAPHSVILPHARQGYSHKFIQYKNRRRGCDPRVPRPSIGDFAEQLDDAHGPRAAECPEHAGRSPCMHGAGRILNHRQRHRDAAQPERADDHRNDLAARGGLGRETTGR